MVIEITGTARLMLVATALCLGGCSEYTSRHDGISLHAGDAVAANRAIHVINPWPSYAANVTGASDGARAGAAVRQYRYGPEAAKASAAAPASSAAKTQ